MSYISAGRSAATAGLACGERGEVIVMDVTLAIFDAEAVKYLLIGSGAQGGDGQHLGLPAGEQAGAVRSGQHAYFDGDRADVCGAAAIRALAALQYSVTHFFLQESIERLFDLGHNLGLLVVGSLLD